MKNAGAIVWWIDRNCSVQSDVIHPYHLRGAATYRSEAIWRTNCAEHFEVIILDHANGLFGKEAIERLKSKADEMRKALANKDKEDQ
jgi:hypothetical protein